MTKLSVTHATFTVDRTYDEPPAQVFKALSDPAIKRRWFAEGEGWEVEEFTSDFRVGGTEVSRFRFQGGAPMRNDTIFHDIVPDERIIFTYTMIYGEMRLSSSLATIQLTPAGSGTKLVYTEQGAYLDGHDDVVGREKGVRELYDALAKELKRLR